MPFFTYNTGIPAANNDPSGDQPNMQTNTNSINSILNVDHHGFNDNDGGLHRQTTFVNETIPSTAVNQTALWSQASGQSQIFATTDAGAKAYQMTRMIDASFAQFATDTALMTAIGTGAGTGGWTFLPGGLLIQTGACINGPEVGGNTYNFPIPFTSTPFSCIACVNANTTARFFINVVVFNATDFSCVIRDASGTSTAQGFSWMAIGI